jgi:hypothetical protein
MPGNPENPESPEYPPPTPMKPAKIFHQYIWIINKLKSEGPLTFERLNEMWQKDGITDGNALQRSSFNRHRDAILNMFGIIINCDKRTYEYYIQNPSAMGDESIERWLLSTLTIHGMLADSASVKERVVLEEVPAGLEYLDTLITAIKTNRRVRMGYKKFGAEGYVKTVCPYALKLFHQRWYLLALNDAEQMRIYALDRMTEATLTDETFTMPPHFSPQHYFDEYYGVLADGTPMAHVVIRAHRWTPNYLRTLPLHHSQREITENPESPESPEKPENPEPPAPPPDYADFCYDLRPTADFLGQLLQQGDGIEVLEPLELRQKMQELTKKAFERYK